MIADILPRYQVTSDGSTVAYTVPFELIENNLVNVYVASEKQSSGYSVNVSTKTITFENAPEEGELITIIRAIPISWEVSDFGSLNEESLDKALTLLTAKMQTLEEEISRSPKTNPYDKETGSDLSELFFTEMRDALDSLERAKVIYAQIQASGAQALADITTEKNSAISDIDDNSSDRIGEFNLNATNKTTAFNTNANTVTDTFNQNATNKTDAFNTNAAQKQAAVDASATAAATSAANAATSATNAATSETNAAAAEARINETLSTYVTYVGDPTGEVTLKNKDDQTLIPYTELATANKVGRVKPDGTTTSVDNNGAMSVIGKQDTLVSGTNIKTVNGNSLLGSGNMTIGAQVSYGNITGTLSDQTDLQDALDAKANDSDVVKLTGNQTIAGAKTFTDNTTVKKSNPQLFLQNSNITKGTTPSSNVFTSLSMGGTDVPNSDVTALGRVMHGSMSDGESQLRLRAYKNEANSTDIAEIVIHNTLTGEKYATCPTPATSDNSTKIATTANVDAKITAQAVKLTGDQSINGLKTFNDTMFTKNLYARGNITLGTSTNTWGHMLQFQDTAGKRISRVQPLAIDTTKNKMGMWVNNADNTAEYGIEIWSDGTAVAPTPATSDSSSKIATTANVDAKITAQAVKLTGNQTIAGVKTFNANYAAFKGINIDITNAKTTQNDVGINWLDKNGAILGQNHIRTYTNGAVQNNMYIRAHNSNTWASISIGFDANDNVFTYAPTPGATDNSSNIATTAFVKNQGDILLPTGTILPYGGSTAPSGFLLCNGGAISRTTYAKLFSVIGTTYGEGDGSTTFNLPNGNNRSLWGNSRGYLSGIVPQHTHTVSFAQSPGWSGGGLAVGSGVNVTSSGANNNKYTNDNIVRPESLCVNYIIKY